MNESRMYHFIILFIKLRYNDNKIKRSLDIATQSRYLFERSSNIDLKRLLLKFVFENITLTEGEISYKLNFPFNEFVNTTILRKKTATSYELMQSQANQGLHGNDNENIQMRAHKPHELAVSLKNQGLAKNFANPIQTGWGILWFLELFMQHFLNLK